MRADSRSLVVAWTLVTAVLMLGIFSVSCGAAEPTPAPTARAAPTTAPPPAAATPTRVAGAQPTQAPATPRPAATAAPAPATPSPVQQIARPTGVLTISVGAVDTPNGLPRFCTAGCAETIYHSGIAETLFGAIARPDGTPDIDPLLALEFKLDPGLKFADFTLRQGVQFHDGWGEMTAEDVAFSFNDANSVTNPESIHGQAGDFAPLIQSMEPLDRYTIRLNYRNYDSRGVLHRFSNFWQTAAIVSKKVFDTHGVEGMQNIYVGTGPFEAEEWVQNKDIVVNAFPDYWGAPLGLGPFVEKIRWLEVREGASRRAMLETGEAQIAQIELKDVPELKTKGFMEQRGALHNVMMNISFTGNYWEQFGALTGDKLDRNRDTTKPWVGNPFENGDTYDENTPSMQRAMKVRNALAHAIERDALVESLISGLGWVNHQPYLSVNNPNYKPEWGWETDFNKAKQLLSEADYPNGFEMDVWVGTGQLTIETGQAVGAKWQEALGIKVNFIQTAYSTYRPGLVARSTSTPFYGCGDENHSNFPYDWAHGFVMSSVSAGGYGVGMEVPFATETYFAMAGEPDKAKREALSEKFYSENRRWALCVGVFEYPIWPMYNVNKIAAWDQRPDANGNLNGINNVRSIKLK